jgi:SPP1 gp7 family putative phage head morphogenesis protein
MAKSSRYWDNRALRRLSESEKLSEAHIKRIKKIYEKAYRDINRDINNIYKNYSKDTGLDVEKLKELLTKKETDKVWKTLKRQGLDKYIKDNYKARISRLEQIQAQIYAKAKQIYPKEELEHKMAYEGVVNQSYYKAVYDTQMGTGYDFSFNKIDKNLMDSILSERWSGKNYSQRVWGNTDILAESLSEVLGGGLLSGQSIAKTSKQIRERFKVSQYYAERLVRTETNHFNNTADAMAYEEMGVEMYVFVATLDERTSEKCQDMDGKKFAYKDKEEGVNYPPLHPNCRSKTRGYIDEETEKSLKRRARNLKTGKTEIIDNISYKEWAEKNGLVTKPKTNKTVNTVDKKVNKPVKIKQKNINADKNTGDFTTLEEQLKNVENKIKNQDYETMIAFDNKGNIVYRKDGNKEQIELDFDSAKDKLSNNIVTHNHPASNRFSDGDISSFVAYDMQELRAVTKEGNIYSIKKIGNNQNGQSLLDKYDKLVIDKEEELMSFFMKQLEQDGIDLDSDIAGSWEYYEKVKRKFNAEWLTENANKYGYEYKELSLFNNEKQK